MTIAFVGKGANSIVAGAGSRYNTATKTGVTAGNWLICPAWGANSSGVTTAIPADTTNGWTMAANGSGQADGSVAINNAIQFKKSVAGGTETCVTDFTATDTYSESSIIEVSATTGLIVDRSATGSGATASSTTGTAGPTAATSVANAFVVAVANALNSAYSTAAFSNASSGYTAIYTELDASVDVPGNTAYKAVTSTGAQSATWTWTANSVWVGRLVAFIDAAAGVTAALTGVTATGSAGTVGPNSSKALTGSSATSTPGTVKATSAKALTGNAGTGSPGTVVPNVVIGLTGVSATGSVGTVTASTSGGPVTAVLTGVSGTGSAGTVAPAASVPLSGVAATSSPGQVGASVSIALTGVSAAGSVGTVSPGNSVPLTGNTATGAPGTVTASQGLTLPLSGVSGTGSAGTVSPSVVVGLTGVSATATAGTVTPTASKAVSGNSAAGSVGSVAPATTVALAGVSGSGTPGNVTVFSADVTIALTGVTAYATAGNVTPVGGTPAAGFPGFEVDQRRPNRPSPRRRLPEVHRKPVLQRALEKRLQRVRPKKDRAAARAKAIEFEAAALVLDGATEREIVPLLQEWEAQRPYIPPQLEEVPTLTIFLSQIGFRIEQAQAAKTTMDAVAKAKRQDEDALLALMLA